MRGIIVVDEPADCEKWKAKQKSWASQNPDYLAKLNISTEVEGVAANAE